MSSLLYFAYGTNMTPTRMARLCKTARFIAVARVDDWKFRICLSGYATIVPSPGARVHGVLWQIEPDDLQPLDDYEKVEKGLYRRDQILLADQRKALVYLARDERPGVPRVGYLEEIIAAAFYWGLPEQRYG
jgi:gamma-glutamylcyclotransferase (GGCT)/AIG2-like uncharacterized protein YtfP